MLDIISKFGKYLYKKSFLVKPSVPETIVIFSFNQIRSNELILIKELSVEKLFATRALTLNLKRLRF